MVNISVSMAAQPSDQDDLKSGAIIQMECHNFTPPNGLNGPEETEAFGSALSHSPSQSLARKPSPDHPETWYCLEIQVILTENGGKTPPPTHAWQAPMVEDMLIDGKSGLMEVVVTGRGWAILFYRRQSLGEGLSLGETRYNMFMPSGAISWVGKQAQLNANAVSLWEGWQLIAQAITEHTLNPEDLDILTWFHLHHHCLASAVRMSPHRKWGSQLLLHDWRCPGITIKHHTMNEAEHYNAAGTMATGNETLGLPWPHPPHLHWIMVWEWQMFSVSLFIKVQKIWRFQASTPWLMPPGAQRSHENQSAHL